ncbi:MAG: hypothetical protein M3319_06665 [Actinomycetota bacterium]|nr:hypothetical protein [Actinomycetota bacterium]MDQ3900132.1 hypothetical protein [Actinomycetota bacterium]
MAELTCQQCREVAAELALDVLPCRQRADALAHLERCAPCQDTVSALTLTADRLVELLPAVEPPAGFEQRVISALTLQKPRARRRWWILAAAGLVAIALAAGGWILSYSYDNGAPAEVDAQADERTVLYAPLTTAQHQIGNAYVYPGTPSWIYLSLDGGTASNTVHCDVVRRDGSAVRVGTFPLSHGHGAWGGPAPVDRNTLATARLTDGRGATLATAHFGSPPHRSDGFGSHSHVDHRHRQHPR